MLAEREILVSYETVRRGVNHFGPPKIAADVRKRRPKPHATWHRDEIYLRINGRMVYLWRAVDGNCQSAFGPPMPETEWPLTKLQDPGADRQKATYLAYSRI